MASNLKAKKPRPKANQEKPELKPELNTDKTEIAHDENFAQVVAESKEVIHAQPLEKVRSKRGRPSLSEAEKIARAKASNTAEGRPSQGHPTNNDSASGESSTDGRPGQSNPGPSAIPFLVAPIKALSNIPAANHKMPELAFSEEEAHACAVALDQLLQAYIPDLNNMSPKAAAVLGCCLTFGSIGFNKYAIFQKIQSERMKAEPAIIEPTIISEPAKTQDEAIIGADNFFGRKVNQ